MKRRFTGISERDVMKLPRRNFLHLAAGAAALPSVSRIARAQDRRSRPVRIIVGFTAGSATDIMARLFAQKLNEAWKTPVTVENIPGAGGSVGAERVAKSAPDGSTLADALAKPPNGTCPWGGSRAGATACATARG